MEPDLSEYLNEWIVQYSMLESPHVSQCALGTRYLIPYDVNITVLNLVTLWGRITPSHPHTLTLTISPSTLSHSSTL